MPDCFASGYMAWYTAVAGKMSVKVPYYSRRFSSMAIRDLYYIHDTFCVVSINNSEMLQAPATSLYRMATTNAVVGPRDNMVLASHNIACIGTGQVHYLQCC